MSRIKATVKATGDSIAFETNESISTLKALNHGLIDFEYV